MRRFRWVGGVILPGKFRNIHCALRTYLMVGWVFLCAVAQAQTNEWTWISGPQTPQRPVYGALGTPAASNLPGNRELAANWTDANGNFWIFGGLGRDSTPIYGQLNDLLRYAPSTNEWTWMGGSSTSAGATGVYGSQGQPAPGNIPPGREGASTWVDAKGNFWLFGGADFYQSYNDLWEYSPTSNQWTWVSGADQGNQPGVYGTLGTSATTNVPGARTNAASWMDSKGNLWLFGGDGQDSTQTTGYLNDLWKYDPSIGQWTWIGGSSSLPACNDCGQPGVYGQKGVPAAANIPGGRYASSWWADKQGKFWLFGGSAVDSAGKFGVSNDLWTFNPVTGQWTWISGSQTYPENCGTQANACAAPGVYGRLQTANATNYPGSRSRGLTWVDNQGKVWLFGGLGSDAAGTSGYLNDLWRYDPSTNQWAWMSGDDTVVCLTFCGQPGVYGSLQTPALGNTPSGRNNAVAWTDSKGDLWLFGGTGNDVTESWGYFQDIWEFQPNTNGQPVTATPTFSPLPGSDMSPQIVTIDDTTPGSTIYYTIDGNVPALEYTAPVPLTTSETIIAIASASGYANSDVATGTYTVSAVPAAAPVFSPASGDYPTAQTVSLTDATPGATIYYTTDGTLPTSSSAVYQGPITVSSSQVAQAIAAAPRLPASALASAVYTITSTAPSGLGGWTWTGGSLQVEQAGVYGTMGVPAAGNVPGAREGSTSWKDASGNLWLFGGTGFDSAGASGFLNDLWKYNPSTQQWTWIAGSKTLPCSPNTQVLYCGGLLGVYGTLGSPSPANMPGGRYGGAAWTDSDGHLWLFGGYGMTARGPLPAELNDLWEFDPAAAVWTWMGGSSTSALSFYSTLGQPGVYGTLGVPAATNIPGSRYSSATWVDRKGNFWLFGGTGQDADGLSAQLNDLWMFDLSTHQWTWIGGSNAVEVLLGYQSGVYGTLGVPDEGNIPASRSSAAAWADSSGNLWLFGGDGGQANYALNDLWKYDPSSHLWAWMAGSNNSLHPEVRGTLGIPAEGNTPGAGNISGNWTDQQGNLWLLGGDNASITGADLDSYLGAANELWVYNPSIDEWAWMGGEDPGNCQVTLSVYAYPTCNEPQGVSRGVPAGGQVPAPRGNAASWTDNTGKFWLFSGGAPGSEGAFDFLHYINDVWQYQPSVATLPAAAPPIFSSQSVVYQPGGKVTLANGMANASFYYTTDGSAPTTASKLYSGPITIASSETVKAMATATGYDNSIVTSTTYTVYPLPATPVFSIAPGTYTSIQTVAITDTTANATIYYTTDGSTPTSLSPVYRGPVTVSSSEKLNAVAVTYLYGGTGPGSPFPNDALPSAMATAAYTIHLPPAAAPAFSVPPGTYTSIQTVTISDTTPDATIYYTANGAIPTTSSSVYKGPITVSATETITAIAVATGYVNSTPAVAQYTINLPLAATPTFSVPPGTYTSPQTVVIRDATAGATIYYSSSDYPGTQFIYSQPLVVWASVTITAYSSAPGYQNSATAKAQYTINLPPAATPAFSVPQGTYTSPQTVTITDTTAGASIYYFVNKGAAVAYTAPIQVSTSETISAFAAAQGYANSALATAAYTIQAPPAATPAFSIPPGTYPSPQTVTISDATAGAKIYYTTDGSTPTAASTPYAGPISVSTTETLAAIAVADGYANSAIASAQYVVTAPTVEFTVAPSTTSVTLAAGQSAPVSITITPLNGFHAAVSFSCSGLPAGASCSFSPATVTPSGGPIATTVTITAPPSQAALSPGPGPLFPSSILMLSLGGLWWKKRRWLPVCMFVACAAGLSLLNGCGGGSSMTPPANTNPPVTSAVTVTATAGSLQYTTTIALTINGQ